MKTEIVLETMPTYTQYAPLAVLGYCLTRTGFLQSVWSRIELGDGRRIALLEGEGSHLQTGNPTFGAPVEGSHLSYGFIFDGVVIVQHQDEFLRDLRQVIDQRCEQRVTVW